MQAEGNNKRAPAGAHIQMTRSWMLRGRTWSSRGLSYRHGLTATLHPRFRSWLQRGRNAPPSLTPSPRAQPRCSLSSGALFTLRAEDPHEELPTIANCPLGTCGSIHPARYVITAGGT